MPTLPLPPNLLRAAGFLPSIALSPAKEARCARDKERHYFGQAWVASKMPKLEPLSHFQQRSAWCKPTPYFILKRLCSAGPYVQPVISCDWFTSIFLSLSRSAVHANFFRLALTTASPSLLSGGNDSPPQWYARKHLHRFCLCWIFIDSFIIKSTFHQNTVKIWIKDHNTRYSLWATLTFFLICEVGGLNSFLSELWRKVVGSEDYKSLSQLRHLKGMRLAAPSF